jgi:repressor LexA
MNELVDTFANRLTKAITIRNIKPIELSEKTGINKSKISSYMSGRYKAKQDGIHIISQALNVDPAWLMGYDVPMDRNFDKNITGMDKKVDKGATVFVYGTIPAGTPIELIEDIIDTEEIDADMLKGGKEYFGLRIKGNSMNPDYLDGDVIIFQKQDDCENGEDCVVMVNGNDGTFKRVFKNEEAKTITLQPLNMQRDENGKLLYEPMTFTEEQIEALPVRILGVFEELRRKKKRK